MDIFHHFFFRHHYILFYLNNLPVGRKTSFVPLQTITQPTNCKNKYRPPLKETPKKSFIDWWKKTSPDAWKLRMRYSLQFAKCLMWYRKKGFWSLICWSYELMLGIVEQARRVAVYKSQYREPGWALMGMKIVATLSWPSIIFGKRIEEHFLIRLH